MPNEIRRTGAEASPIPPQIINKIIDTLKGIRYGAVEIIVHEGHIVQIERKEKLRFDLAGPVKSN